MDQGTDMKHSLLIYALLTIIACGCAGEKKSAHNTGGERDGGANTSADKQSMSINYRVWVQDGEMTIDEIEALSRDFVQPIRAKQIRDPS